MSITVQDLNTFLDANSCESKFYIEYSGFLSNHLGHAAIALYKLGDEKDHFLAYLVDHYSTKLETKDGMTCQSQRAQEEETVDALLGQRRGYYKLLSHYKTLYSKTSNISELLRTEFPKLSPGIICSALHPLIHIGYALDVKNHQMVLEGLAYLHHSYRPFIYSSSQNGQQEFTGKGSRDILDVLAELRNMKNLQEFRIRRGAEIRAHLDPRNIFQTEAMALLEKGDLFATLTRSIKIPESHSESPEQLVKWALDQAIIVFQSSTLINDFLFVHGITSAWSLSKICQHLDEKDALDAIFCYLNCLLVVYVRQGCPKLDLKRLEKDASSESSWKDLVKMALKLPLHNLDEHVFKLVQICKERAEENPDMNTICKRATLTAISSSFTFTPAQME